MPGAERVKREIRAQSEQHPTPYACFPNRNSRRKTIAVVTEGTDAKHGVLDPLGATLEDGPDLYFNLIRNLAKSMRDCLSRPK